MGSQTLDDVDHTWGQDVVISPTGDLARVNRLERSKQHVLRRLLTAVLGYAAHPDYGGGLPAEVGELLNKARIVGKVRGQMALEASVSPTPAPDTKLDAIQNGVSASIVYTALPDGVPVTLDFSLEA